MASYNPPNPYVPNAFNPTQFITPSDNITTKFLDENYLRFPFAQGTENFVSINNQGSLTQSGLADFSSNTTPAIFNLPPTITNPILDTATTPLNAVATIGYVLANEQGGSDLLPLDNLWTGVNNFNPTPIQPYGGVMTQGITITNNQNSSTLSGENDIISYTPSSTQGLCIFSSSTNSVVGKTSQIELQPDGVKTSLFANGTNGVVQLNALGGTQSKIILQASSGVFLQLNPTINFNNWGTLSTTSGTSGLISDVNITSTGFAINDTVNNKYLLYSQNNYGLVIANTTGGNGILTLSNSGTTLSTLSATTDGLDISTAVTLPAQTTYTPSTTYGDVGATQQFVQKAVETAGGNTFDDIIIGTNGASSTLSNTNNGYGLNINTAMSVGNIYFNYGENKNGAFIQPNANGSLSVSANNYNLQNNAGSGKTTIYPYEGYLSITNPVEIPSQTYSPSTTYGNYASTQRFVQLAIQSTGSVTLSGTNNFTGTNTFNTIVPTTSLQQTYPSSQSTSFATIGYVNSLPVSNVTLGGTNNFTGTNTYNTKLPTSTIGGVYPNFSTTDDFATIGYVNSITATVASSASPSVGVFSMGPVNYVTGHITTNILYYNGFITFNATTGATKSTFNLSPILTSTFFAVNFQTYSLYDAQLNSYISIDTTQSFISNSNLAIFYNSPSPGDFYQFIFSGTIQL